MYVDCVVHWFGKINEREFEGVYLHPGAAVPAPVGAEGIHGLVAWVGTGWVDAVYVDGVWFQLFVWRPVLVTTSILFWRFRSWQNEKTFTSDWFNNSDFFITFDGGNCINICKLLIIVTEFHPRCLGLYAFLYILLFFIGWWITEFFLFTVISFSCGQTEIPQKAAFGLLVNGWHCMS